MAKAAADRIDYTDCVRNIREYAVRLSEIAQQAGSEPDELRRAVSHLEASALALEERQALLIQKAVVLQD